MIYTITKPTTFKLSDITEPSIFNVTVPMDDFAVTFKGDVLSINKSNRFDGYLPRIVVNCNYLSKGVKFDKIDNAVIDNVEVHRALDSGILFQTIRQSHIRTIVVNECFGVNPAISFQSNSSSDSCNALNIDFVTVLASSNPVYLSMSSGFNITRNINFGTVFLHTPWPQLQTTDNPKKEIYLPQDGRTLLQLDKVARLYISSLNCRLDDNFSGMNTAIKLTECNGIVIRGSIIREKHQNLIVKDDVSTVETNILVNLKTKI